MRIGIIGGGMVGQTLGRALAAQGNAVTIGIREPSAAELARERRGGQPLADWAEATGAAVATMAGAAAGAELVINATEGTASLAALALCGPGAFDGKVLLDVSNPLDFSRGMPPFLSPDLSGGTSLGEAIQAAHPAARVVKAFNTVADAVMVNPALIPGDHDLLICGNDAGAKATVTAIAHSFGWGSVVDLGDITAARGTEGLLPLWLRLWQVTGTRAVNIRVVRG